ncbi:MAG: hypothetical protein Q8S44_09270 [Flavobacteriaceae bacterium]|nr:hypothetical protein [Flavobacteriaceae bacterium]
MKKYILLWWALQSTFVTFSQDFGIQWKGFVKADYFFDTRQTVTAREGHFLLYPENKLIDKTGKDINAASSLNMLAVQTRLTGMITGPEVLGAKSSGMIEGEFFGHSDGDINGFRLRHAITKLNWKKTELLFGQTWHPMFITECFPEVISFNTGVPFTVFSRNPQVKLTHKEGNFSVSGALLSQRDFASFGGSASLRNASIPDMQLQTSYRFKKLLVGGGLGYKELLPRLKTDSSYVENGRVKGLTAMAYARYDNEKLTLKIEGVYGANMFDAMMLGGYALKKPSNINDLISYDYRTYTTINNMSFWTELMTKGKSKMQYGLFGGYTKNLGAEDEIYNPQSSKSYFSRGSNIDYVFRISPRAVYTEKKIKFAFETEYTVAGYGNTRNSFGEVQDKSSVYPNANINDVANLRLLFSVIYSF